MTYSLDDIEPGQRVEVLMHRGEADVWYRGTTAERGRVILDDGFPYGSPPGPQVAEPAEIADWRPIR